MEPKKSLLSQITDDTLKKDGKWSRTSLTMLTAWIMACGMALWDFIQNGFDFQVFLTFVGVATGVKVMDAWSKKLNKPEDANTSGGSQ